MVTERVKKIKKVGEGETRIDENTMQEGGREGESAAILTHSMQHSEWRS